MLRDYSWVTENVINEKAFKEARRDKKIPVGLFLRLLCSGEKNYGSDIM